MTFGKKTLFSLLLGLDLLTNVLEFAHVNFLFTTTLISFCTYIILPGFLISLILRINKISFWENLIITVGLSIAFLEFGGLLLNTLLPLIGIKDPLAFQNILLGFNIYVLLLFLFAWIRTKPLVTQTPEQRAFENADTVISTSIIAKPSVEAGPTTDARPSRFVKPGFTQIPKQPNLILTSSPKTPVRPSQFIKPGFIAKGPENLDPKPNFIDAHDKGIENLETIIAIPITHLPHPKRSKVEKVLSILPVFFPILATLGAIVLNNGGSNILTFILLGAIAFYSLLLILLRDKIGVNLYPYSIFFIAIACLFTTSLRSWYIAGHDIETEFYVFQLTNTHHIWNMAFFQDPYNACLSITILPTILTNLLSIQDMYIYKVFFQILFATVPVLVFFIAKNYTTPIFSFLSAFIFISLPTFFNDMPWINRQEIGFIFFGLVLYMLLLPKLYFSMRRILFILFALSIIISHYSTNFVLLASVTFVYVLTHIISLPFVTKTFALLLSKSHIRPKMIFPHKAFLSLPLVTILLVGTFFWNTIYTNSSNTSASAVKHIINNVFVQSNSNSQSIDASFSIFSSRKPTSEQLIQEYIQSIIQSKKENSIENTNQLYSTSITRKYPNSLVQQEQLAPTPLGEWLSSFHIPVFNIQAELNTFFFGFMHIFPYIGVLVILFFKQKRRELDLQYLLLYSSGTIFLAFMFVLPGLSEDYGEARILQQYLFIFALPIVLVLNSVLFFAKEQKRIVFTGIIAILFFLNSTGFISHITGDYYPQMTLDNAGMYYDKYYVYKSDVLAIAWLSKDNVNHEPIQADSDRQKFLPYGGGIYASNDVFPQTIQKNAYVYLTVWNDKVVVIIASKALIYNSPKDFLDDNKDQIYSNGRINIYK